MKSNIQKIIFFAAVAVLSSAGCKKFIKEELVTTLTEDYYKTDAGLEDLVKSAYAPLQWKFTEEQAYAMYDFGTDQFREADQFNNVRYNDYDANLNANDPFVNGLWTNNYAGIRRCNQGIEGITNLNAPSSKVLGTQAQKDIRIAELKALRAFYYFQLVQQFGAIPLVTSVPAAPQYEFPRAPVAAVYEQIISDFKSAGPALQWRQTGTERGRATRAMAYHFLARAYLTRGSAVNDARGQKSTDMDSAVYFANDVIANSGHSLEVDYGNLFNAAYPDGRIPPLTENGAPPTGSKARIDANNASNEIIFAAQFSSNLALAAASGGGNQTHLYYLTQYDVGIPGMTRDFFNGRPFRRVRPTDYTIDIYDKINDSRFFKTFQTVYYRNVTTLPTIAQNPTLYWNSTNAPSPALVGKAKVMLGDTAAIFIVNPIDRPITSADSAAMRYYGVFARYKQATAGGPIIQGFTANKSLNMIKHNDPIRLTTTNNEARGIRNGTFARLAETYLILAEAYGRKGDYGNALKYVNVLRTRAAYKSNEERSSQIWRFMGGPNTLANTENNNQATQALFTTNAPSEYYPANVVSITDRFIHFMLNERTRELCGEFIRWEDLVRTETLYDRTKLHNPDITGSFAPYHKLRPIPYLQMISQTLNGKPMGPAEMAQYQNPGY